MGRHVVRSGVGGTADSPPSLMMRARLWTDLAHLLHSMTFIVVALLASFFSLYLYEIIQWNIYP